LAEQGPRALTAKALGAAVGIDHSTVFRHFPDKAAIIDAALDDMEASLQESFPAGELSPLARLEAFLRHRLALVRRRPELMRLAMDPRLLATAADPKQARRLSRITRRSVEFIESTIAAGQAEGAVRAAPSAHTLTLAFTGVVRGAVQAPARRRPTPDEVWGELAALLSP